MNGGKKQPKIYCFSANHFVLQPEEAIVHLCRSKVFVIFLESNINICNNLNKKQHQQQQQQQQPHHQKQQQLLHLDDKLPKASDSFIFCPGNLKQLLQFFRLATKIGLNAKCRKTINLTNVPMQLTHFSTGFAVPTSS